MAPGDLAFAAPTKLGDVLGELVREGAVAVAGGTSIAMLLKNDLLEVDTLVSLRHVAELRGIELGPTDEVRLGAMVTMREVVRSPLVRERLPALAQAAGHVGNPRVRAVATVGGALAHADPRQDVPPALLALGATVTIGGWNGERRVPLSDFLLGFLTTALDDGELILDVRIPGEAGLRSSYQRFTPGSGTDYPTVAVAAMVSLSSDGIISSARIALGGAGPTAVLAEEAACLLIGHAPERDTLNRAAAIAGDNASPSSDHRGSAGYKRAMLEVWTSQALHHCLDMPTVE